MYGELKLSEKLSNELQAVRDQVEALNESLEEACYERDQYKSEVMQLKKQMEESNNKVRSYKKEIVDMMQKQHRAKIDYE